MIIRGDSGNEDRGRRRKKERRMRKKGLDRTVMLRRAPASVASY
jgi:hypothetical protein